MADNVAEERIDLDDPRYPPELYHHVQDMINQLSTGHQEVSGQFPVPVHFPLPYSWRKFTSLLPICPPPKIEIAFKTLKNRIYYDKRRSPQPLYKTEAAWIQHHWRRVHGNVVIPVPAPSSKVRQSSRGATKEVYRCPLNDTRSAKAGCESWAYRSVKGYCENHFHLVHCAIETRYMTDWPWQHGDLPWMTGQLPLADEELRDYIYRVVDRHGPPSMPILSSVISTLCLIILWRTWLTSGGEQIQSFSIGILFARD
ncbi:hypothetical protein BDZ89DRAFT_1207189 [Hymenopellis radicata]|nr:hypothetical protein BDZ89DRAFT_1207189 [Hymenopellis radicata]